MANVTWDEEVTPVFFWVIPWVIWPTLCTKKGSPSDSSHGPEQGEAPCTPLP